MKKSVNHASGKASAQKWSAKVTKGSNALDLRRDVFKSSSSEAIARSLKHSAEKSTRRKSTPFQSAMSMLNFYINRGGRNLSQTQKKILEKTKDKLRELFGKEKKQAH